MTARTSKFVGISFDAMGTLIHVKANNVGAQYQKAVRQAWFDAADPKPGCLAEVLADIDSRRLNDEFKGAFKDVAAKWPELAAADRHLRETMGGRKPTVGGACTAETYAFWKHIVHEAYSRALRAKGKGKGLAMMQPGGIASDAEFASLFDTIFTHFNGAEPYAPYDDTAQLLMVLGKTISRGSSASGGGEARGRFAVGSADRAVNPFEWHGNEVTRQQRDADALAAASDPEGKPRLARVSVVTNFDGRMHRILQAMSLEPSFHDVFTIHEVPRKPSPEGILRSWGRMDPHLRRAIQQTGKPPAERRSAWLHVGDSPLDAEAAEAAGAEVLLVDPAKGATIAAVAEKLGEMGVKIDVMRYTSFDQFEDVARADPTTQAYLQDAYEASKTGNTRNMSPMGRDDDRASVPPVDFKMPPPPSNLR